jgi:hypothetical protein
LNGATPFRGCMTRDSARITALRERARSGTTMPMRGCGPPGVRSRRARAQHAAASISSRADMNAVRRAVPPAPAGGGAHSHTSTPFCASTARKAACCGVRMSNP